MKLSIRPFYYYLLAFSLFLLTISYILQIHFHLEPCSLCILARIIVFFLTFIFAIAIWHNPKQTGIRFYSLMAFIMASLGLLVTGRHLWILHLPAELAPSCSPSLNYLLETLPITKAVMIVLKGSGQCAENQAVFLGLTLPGWTMIAFIIVAIGSLFPLFTKKRRVA